MPVGLGVYSALAVPILTTVGTYLIAKKDHLQGQDAMVSLLVGGLLWLAGILIFYFAAKSQVVPSKRNNFIGSTVTVIVTMALGLYSWYVNNAMGMQIFALLTIGAYIYFWYTLCEMDFSLFSTQYVTLAIAFILIAALYLVPCDSKHKNGVGMGLPLLAIGWTLLATTGIPEFRDEVL